MTSVIETRPSTSPRPRPAKYGRRPRALGSAPPHGAGEIERPPPAPFPLLLHFCCAAWKAGELGSTPEVIFSRTRPPDMNCGSGKLGTLFLRMQAANASALDSSCACCPADGG